MRVLLIQPSLDPPGGGNLVAAWMLEALRGEHALGLLAWQRPDLTACNRFYGTTLSRDDFRLHLVPPLVRAVGGLTPTPLSLLKHGYLLRVGTNIADEYRYDLMVTANNEADFGRFGIQYIHYPKLDLVRPDVDLRWYHASRSLLELYYRLCERVARFSSARMKANLTLVNSEYIAERVRRLHGIEPVVLHPPVPGEFPSVPWDERANGFVCIGRISPEKRVHEAVEILSNVRRRGHDVRLHIVGSDDDDAYARRIARLVADNGAWVTRHRDLPRAELVTLASRQRYGIHAMPDEHFGIAVAEMVRAGCIAFVPATGGPVEIVGREPTLLFGSPAQASDEIVRVLEDESLQRSLRARSAVRAGLFSAERFASELRAHVAAAATRARGSLAPNRS